MNAYLDRPVVGITYSSQDLEDFALWRSLFHGFVAAGATPVGIDCAVEQPRIDGLVRRLDGLVVSGGGDVDPALYGGATDDELLRGVNHARDVAERSALDAAFASGIPVLAICRGLQFVNVVLGGTLYADLARDRPGPIAHRAGEEVLDRVCHDVEVEPGTLLAAWLGDAGTIAVNSEHHQGIRDLAPGLTAVAHAPDGLVEAVQLPERRLVGVQWHPEILWPNEPSSLDLLVGFVEECGVQVRSAAPA
ncbi:putative glutamine amidotransferase [Nocardioides aromaticivorans]|uniref:Putative glutamine amidotransferase n=1 Tax=Nocardioides aromaticivorans TaxID=200618 RepID=A0A7Z0CN48_9ACTN|nr:gamma-glutamyl-gamma-aminobutyrate hydrolase family protein [Nocardioides aromaticivorans]NYI44535.1 putative glutamine amidotransferase [Nocardioides aromaticivorans]